MIKWLVSIWMTKIDKISFINSIPNVKNIETDLISFMSASLALSGTLAAYIFDF